uniref:Pol polyprotein n=1 Tax=Tanacetum cinerariifolium TaxID=118510 RepID=A0A6L2N4U4_TANCI|nr:Pol polyprotein [Tanacetum cinerariifolium]
MISDFIATISEVNQAGLNTKEWCIDTSATRQVCLDKSLFSSLKEINNGENIFMGNSITTNIKGKGDVILKWTSEKDLKLKNVLYVLGIRRNLVSGWLLNKHGFCFVFQCNTFELTKNKMVVVESSNVWHGQLGHVNYNDIRRLMKSKCIPTFHIDSNHMCQTCAEAKITRSSFHSVERKTDPLDLIHTDVCALKSVSTRGDNKYFITFIDVCTKYCYMYLLKSKYEAIDKFILYKNKVENQLNKKIKVVRSDRGGEYVSSFAEFCSQHGIRHEFTAPYLPQQNGIAERKNRTLKEMENAMLISSGLNQNTWEEAISSANYLLNKISCKVNKILIMNYR